MSKETKFDLHSDAGIVQLGLWDTLKCDARHALNGSFHAHPLRWTPLRVLRVILSPQFQVVARFRVYHWLYAKGYEAPAFLLYLRAARIHHCDIAMEAQIGPGLRVGHCSDIVIGPDARIGTDVVLFNGVTLGKRHRRDGQEGMPILGDRVMIGTGAKLLGPISIGSGARIGANAVVLDDVPPDCSAAGNPARILSRSIAPGSAGDSK